MPIHLLSEETISRIAAGEVVERPMNVVKELIENSIDAGADAITCEIRDGGISFLRVTDNGCGIRKEDIGYAFYRHATSKIDSAEDLHRIYSLGFRGEALSSIAAVSEVEMITRCEDDIAGIHVLSDAHNAEDITVTEVGAPKGTTVIVRDLFGNVPVRKKFLRQPQTEGSYITDLIQQFALSHPEISFHYRVNGQEKLHTSGNGSLKEVIYRIYGKSVMDQLIAVGAEQRSGESPDAETAEEVSMSVKGYVSHPQLTRAGRSNEFFFVNGRILKNDLLSKALEEGYGTDLMQHRFPFAVLELELDPSLLDINVHPSKMEIRFEDPQGIYGFLKEAVSKALKSREKIHTATVMTGREEKAALRAEEEQRQELFRAEGHSEPFENRRTAGKESVYSVPAGTSVLFDEKEEYDAGPVLVKDKVTVPQETAHAVMPDSTAADAGHEQVPVQEELPIIFSEEKAASFRIVGQVFSTYWIIESEGRMLMIDQHAAHEKVQYERIMKRVAKDLEGQGASQLLAPPAVVHLSGRQEAALRQHEEAFRKLGYIIESFGGNAYALRGVPAELFGAEAGRMLLDTLDEILEEKLDGTPGTILSKVASMSCKAAVKGGNLLSYEEASQLIGSLLQLEDPYHCPHGRPTMIVFSEDELEKKFKRIV